MKWLRRHIEPFSIEQAEARLSDDTRRVALLELETKLARARATRLAQRWDRDDRQGAPG